jgi:hypothetical protein
MFLIAVLLTRTVTHVEVLLVRAVVVEIHVCGSNRSRHANG